MTPYRLLCVTAHPDDECGGFGGALLVAHQAGAETYLLCLTDGQAAHFRGGTEDNAELGRRRRAELDAACKVLGVTRHELLGLPDGELAHEDFYALAGEIAARIRRSKPQVVLTFGGAGGINLHRDHTMVSAATTAAFHWAGRAEFFPEQVNAQSLAPYAPQKLYYASAPFVSVRSKPELADSPTAPYSLALNLGELAGKKWEAFAKHSSQAGVLKRVGQEVTKYYTVERYLLASARGQISVSEDKGLFDGIVGD